MFDDIPSETIGLEYGPSHLICLLIDYVRLASVRIIAGTPTPGILYVFHLFVLL